MYIICYIIHNYKKLIYIYIHNWLYMIIYHTYISSDTPCSWPLQQVVTGRKSAIDGRPSDCTTQQDLRAISMMGEQTNAIWCYSHLCTNFYVVFPKYPHLLCQHWEDTLRSQFRDGMKCCIRCSAVWESRLGARELLCGSLHDTKSMTQHCTFHQT